MDIMIDRALRFAKGRLKNMLKPDAIINDVRSEVYDIDNELDKVKYLTIILEKNNTEFELHKSYCTDPDDCYEEYGHKSIQYFLNQELNRLGAGIKPDTFSADEKRNLEFKLDEIMKELEKLSLGQQIIYEDLSKELQELRELFFLGKHKWYQLLLGKGGDMVTSGIISETISKEVIEQVKKAIIPMIS